MQPAVVRQALDILATWGRGAMTTRHAQRELVALGFTPDEALDLLAAAKLDAVGMGCGPSVLS